MLCKLQKKLRNYYERRTNHKLGYEVTNYDARLGAITSFRHLIRNEKRDQYLGLQ